MLLPLDILKKMYYYYHNTELRHGEMTDKIEIVYQGWVFKKTLKFDFRRNEKRDEEYRQLFFVADECTELLDQLKTEMQSREIK